MEVCDETGAKAGRRQLKKLRRFQHQLQQQLHVRPVDQPTQIIVLCNAGVATGLRESDLLKTFNEYGPIERIILIPEKSFSIIIFFSVESAILAHKEIHLKRCLSQHGQPLYLSFLPSVPTISDEENANIPEGLILIENFLSLEEEENILSNISFENLPDKSDMKNRRVRHFGYEFLYGKNNIDINNPLDENIPSYCNFLWERLEKHGHSFDDPPNQLTVNQYSPGQGIPSHIDTHSAFLSPLISLSLGSDIVMEFKKKDENGVQQCHKIILRARSILLLDGSSRYEWSHGIVPKTYDMINGHLVERNTRTSFTFRWVRKNGVCNCNFQQQCDTFQKLTHSLDTDFKIAASQIELEHVHKVYDEIAEHFSETRTKIWPCVQNFVEKLSFGSILVDVGCGNGKNMNIRSDIFPVGLEYNNALAILAAWKKHTEDENITNFKNLEQVIQGNCLNLPLKSNCADGVISIAVFHHLVTEERRINAISETVRILRPGGHGLISVWAQDQNKGGLKSSYLKQRRNNRQITDDSNLETDVIYNTSEIKLSNDEDSKTVNVNLPIHTNRKQFLYQDMLVPWKLKLPEKEAKTSKNIDENTFMRFYHVFQEGELESLCRKLDNITIEDSFYEQGNWCIVFKKK